MPRAVYLLRHGQSTWNAERRWQGQGDPPLSELGREQVREAAKRLAGAELEAIVSSDLLRARETAEIVAEALRLPAPEVDPRWREHDVGAWTGLTREEIRARWPELYRRFREGDVDVRIGETGESRAMLASRVHEAVADLRRRFAGQRVLVVTHRGVIKLLADDLGVGNAEHVALAPPILPGLRAHEA